MDTVQNIKSQVSIVDVVGRYRPLVKAGKNFKALCPFHDDHKPSMTVNPAQNFAWCFSCQSGGDVFSFVQKIEGVSFIEAAKIIGEIGGIDTSGLQKQSPAQQKQSQQKKEYSEQLRDVLKVTQQFFLQKFSTNTAAKQYVTDNRKFTQQTIENFGIGYAPDDFHALEKFLITKKISRKQMLDAGVVGTNDEKGEEVFDKFRSRITFPVHDAQGNICGFGGRILQASTDTAEKGPKYMNSPQTVLYDKSQLLFGFDKARTAIRKENMAVLVEGNLDVMTCHEFGITNVVGVSGVGFSSQQAKMLKRFCTRVTLALDGDQAGIRASQRVMEVLFAEGFSVQMMNIPDGKDPDESLRSDAQKFKEALEQSPNAIASLLDNFLRVINTNTVEGKRAVFEKIFPLVQKINRLMEKNEAMEIIAQKLQISPEQAEEEYRDFMQKISAYSPPTPADQATKKKPSISAVEYFFGVLFSFPQYSEEIFSRIKEEFFLLPAEKSLYMEVTSAYTAGTKFCSDTILAPCDPTMRENIKKASLYAQEKLSLLPPAQQKTEIIRMVYSMGKTLLEGGIKQCTQLLRTDPTPQCIEQLQALTLALRGFHHSS